MLKTLENIASNINLLDANLKYCFVNYNKVPFKYTGELAKPNVVDDFVEFEKLLDSKCISDFCGVGISIQASQVTAIDIDKCFKIPFDIKSKDARAKKILKLFKDYYCEFSFSGTGMRILFKSELIKDYRYKYYIKNANNGVEFYQPNGSFRYVTITGRTIYDKPIICIDNSLLIDFLNEYMTRPVNANLGQIKGSFVESKSYDELMLEVKKNYYKNATFQDNWFNKATGSGTNESERDYYLVKYLFYNVTKDILMIKKLFEESPFYKSKDGKHINKWTKSNFRYYNYLYGVISNGG